MSGNFSAGGRLDAKVAVFKVGAQTAVEDSTNNLLSVISHDISNVPWYLIASDELD